MLIFKEHWARSQAEAHLNSNGIGWAQIEYNCCKVCKTYLYLRSNCWVAAGYNALALRCWRRHRPISKHEPARGIAVNIAKLPERGDKSETSDTIIGLPVNLAMVAATVALA